MLVKLTESYERQGAHIASLHPALDSVVFPILLITLVFILRLLLSLIGSSLAASKYAGRDVIRRGADKSEADRHDAGQTEGLLGWHPVFELHGLGKPRIAGVLKLLSHVNRVVLVWLGEV